MSWIPTCELRLKQDSHSGRYFIQQKFEWSEPDWNLGNDVLWKGLTKVPHTALDEYGDKDIDHMHAKDEECTELCMPVAK